jgi:hypothetical protein
MIHAYNSNYMRGIGKMITVPDPHRKKARSYLKNKPKPKRAGSVAQIVELLPSKSKALSSNPSTIKKRDKKKK